MGLLGEEQALGEASAEVGLERCNPIPVQALVIVCPTGEAFQVGLVAAQRDHEAASPPVSGWWRGHHSNASRPSSTTSSSALSRSHQGASMPPAQREQDVRPQRRPAFQHLDRATTLGQLDRCGQPGHTGTDDGDAHPPPLGHSGEGRIGVWI